MTLEADRIRRQAFRDREKELGRRYQLEGIPGQTFTQFKDQVEKEIQAARNHAQFVYAGWVTMPALARIEFERLVASEAKPKKYPAWQRKPGETEDEFKKRFTSTT